VRTIVEKDIVADFCANADGSGKRFNAAARVQREIGRAGIQAYGTGKAGCDAPIRYREILESDLSSQEQTDGPRACRELGTEQAVQYALVAGYGCRRYTVAESGGVIPPEVVAHFCFKLHTGANVECRAAAEAYVIDARTGVAEAEVFGENADFRVICTLALLRQQHRRSEEERCKNKS